MRRHVQFAVVALGVAVVSAVYRGSVLISGALSLPLFVAVFAVAFLFAWVIWTTRHVASKGDATGEPLNRRRVQGAQGVALLTAVYFALWNGDGGVVALLPLWAALLAVALYKLAYRLKLIAR